MHRLIFTGSFLLWATAMTALFIRDVWPAWTAQDAPPFKQGMVERLERREEQYGVFNNQGVRIGTAWSNIVSAGGNTTVYGTAVLSVAPLPELRIETTTEFADDGALDNFMLRVFGVPMTTIKIWGERRGIYFPCELQVGALRRQANLEMSASRMIGDTLRPFSFMPELRVGQSWRMQVLDPLTAAFSKSTQFQSIIATVTGEETIDHLGTQVKCKVVQTSPHHVKAWVGPDGRVLLQEVEMPGVGKIRVRQEKYEPNQREAAKNRVVTHNLRGQADE